MGALFVYMLSPEEGAGFSPEAAGEEGRPVKLKWLFASISEERHERKVKVTQRSNSSQSMVQILC